jgi:predicted transcriptional regulator
MMSSRDKEILPPVPTKASKDLVHRFGENAALKLKYKSGGSVAEIVARLGGAIEHSDPSDKAIPESISVRAPRDFTVFISSFTSAKRDRFTIAHEIGHYLLHYPKVREANSDGHMVATRWVDEANTEQMRAEWEANWFAAGFLMPEKEFVKVHEKSGVSGASEHFGVSKLAAKVRAKTLGLGTTG